jgi:hypothetical protein
MEVLRAMEQDPDIEYMTAMVKKEIEDFKQSSRYARLPQKREDAKGKVQNGEADTKEDSEEEDVYSRAAIYGRMQIQCDMITRMTQAFS